MTIGSALKFRSWMRRRRAGIAVLLTLAVMFNTAPLFAAAASFVESGSHHTMMAGHAHDDMNMPCCDTGNDTGCACMAHCAWLFLSQAMPPVLHTMNNSTHLIMAQQMPVPYVDAPPLRPPRS
jgi:hypothetical protein